MKTSIEIAAIASRFDLSWVEYQRAMIARGILAEVPDDLSSRQPVNAIITFHGEGRFTAG